MYAFLITICPKNNIKILVILTIFIISSTFVFGELPIGEVPPTIVLKDDLGGRLDGTQWSSEELVSGKVIILFYVDPDESDLNNHVSDALKAEKYPPENYGSVAVINMDATWMPNTMIQIKLESKQEDFPRTIYVRDYEKVLVKEWGLADDSSDIVVFDREGTVVFSVDGKLSDVQIKQLLKVVRENL